MRRRNLAAIGLSLMMAGGALAEADDDPRDANQMEVLAPPQPAYPVLAAWFGLEGYCEVRFDVVLGGSAVKVRDVACTHPVFCQEATAGAQRARFRITDAPGTAHPGEVHDVVYPLQFLLQEHAGEETPDFGKPVACQSDLVS